MPETPADLARHNCLRLSTIEAFNNWEFDDGKQKRVIPVTGNFEANSADAVYHAALVSMLQRFGGLPRRDAG